MIIQFFIVLNHLKKSYCFMMLRKDFFVGFFCGFLFSDEVGFFVGFGFFHFITAAVFDS